MLSENKLFVIYSARHQNKHLSKNINICKRRDNFLRNVERLLRRKFVTDGTSFVQYY